MRVLALAGTLNLWEAGPLAGQQVSVSELGIGFPVIVESSRIKSVRIPVANISEGSGRPTGGMPGGMPGSMPGGMSGGMPLRPGADPTQPLEPQEQLMPFDAAASARLFDTLFGPVKAEVLGSTTGRVPPASAPLSSSSCAP